MANPPVIVPTYTADDKAKELQLDMQEQQQLRERSKLSLELRRVKAMERMAKSNFKLFVLAFLKDLSPYLVLVFIILFFIFLSKGGSLVKPVRKLDTKRKRAFQRAQTRWQRFVSWLKAKLRWLLQLFTPGYRTILFLRMFIPFGSKTKYIPRQRMMSGRCDNHRWIQVDGNDKPQLSVDGRRGYCFSALRPDDIKWDLDVSKLPDFHELPNELKKKANAKLSVVIPYDKEDTVRDGNTFFVPRCDKAYYKDVKDATGKNVSAKLLEDMGTSCKLASYSLVKDASSKPAATHKELVNKLMSMRNK